MQKIYSDLPGGGIYLTDLFSHLFDYSVDMLRRFYIHFPEQDK